MANRQAKTRLENSVSREDLDRAIESLRIALKDVEIADVPLAAAYTDLALFYCRERLDGAQ